MKHIDWTAIRAEYTTGGGSYSTLAAKYGLSISTLKKHALKDGWTAAKASQAAEAQRRAADRAADMTASNAGKLERARGILIDKALEAAENIRVLSVNNISELKALVEVVDRLTAETSGTDETLARLDALILAIDRAAQA